MSFIIEGYINQVSYAVNVGLPHSEDIGYKQASGSPSALVLLEVHDGETVDVTPVGPQITADCDTPEGVLALLTSLTEVTDVYSDDGSDVPDLFQAQAGVEH